MSREALCILSFGGDIDAQSYQLNVIVRFVCVQCGH